MNQQCLGTTRSGERCKITGNLEGGYCHLHRKRQNSVKPEPIPEEMRPPSSDAPSRESTSCASSDSSNSKLLIGIFCAICLLILVMMKRRKRVGLIGL